MELISRQVLDLWNKYKPTIAVDAIEYDRELKKLLGTNLAEVGTNCSEFPNSSDTIQPEIVRCEECLYRKICSWEKQGAKFCSFAERREVTT